MHRSVQFLAILYIVLYSIILREGYQEYSKVSGVLYSKAKGYGYTNDSVNGFVFYDSNDLVEPATEADAMFLTNGFVRTIQQPGVCSSHTKCNTSDQCTPKPTSDGEILGTCNQDGYCDVKGWCPLEDDSKGLITVVSNVETFTVFMRSSVKYETFGVTVADPTDPLLGTNLFTLQQIIGSRNISECATDGCIVAVQVDWTCNLNKGPCSPRLSFKTVSGGFNFRKVHYQLGHASRELDKLYGVRLLMKITGLGGRFSIFQTVITIGSGAAFITLATLLTDLVLYLCMKDEESYQDKKWQHMVLT